MARISGVVTLGSGEILGSATVGLLSPDGQTLLATAVSNALTGAYEFTDVPDGESRILVFGDGLYRSKAYLTTVDDYSVNYTSLLHFDGTDGSTTFTDESGKTWTAFGNAQLDTAQFKFGTASALFDGSGDYIECTHSDFAEGTSNFFIEFWVRPATVSGIQILFDQRPAGVQAASPTIYLNGSTLKYFTTGEDRISGGTLVAGAWHHIELSRVSGSTRLFLNGVQIGSTYSDGVNYDQSRIRLGVSGFDGNLGFSGHIDELRVVVGTGGHTSTFTPKTVAHSNGRKVSHLHLDGTNGSTTITDATGKAWVANGTAALTTTGAKFGSACLAAGSLGVKASNHADFILGTADFTVEFWYKPASVIDDTILFDTRASAGSIGPSLYISGGVLRLFANVADRIIGSALTTGVWQHIAVSRSAGVTRMFVNGVKQGSDYTDANNYPDQAVSLGYAYYLPGAPTGGHYDEFRLTRGVGRYVADFTPPVLAFQDPS